MILTSHLVTDPEAKVDTGLRRPPARCSTPSTLARALTEYDGFARRVSVDLYMYLLHDNQCLFIFICV